MSLPQALDALAAQGAAGRAAGAGLEEVLLAYGATKAKLDCMRESACKDCAELLAQAVSFASNGHAGEPDPLLAELCSDGAAQDAGAERPAAELAVAMCAHADALLAAPKQVDEGTVLVAPYGSLAGCEADALFVTGLVNGFFPAYDYFDTTVTMLDKQEGVHRDDARAFYALTACAKSCLRASFFRTMDLEAAEKLRIKVARIYLEGGRRTCRSAPSDFLAAF